jgi:ribosomal protein S18 acetylase RimI-like enzyme
MDDRAIAKTVAALDRFTARIIAAAVPPRARPFGIGDALFRAAYGALFALKRRRAALST